MIKKVQCLSMNIAYFKGKPEKKEVNNRVEKDLRSFVSAVDSWNEVLGKLIMNIASSKVV